MRLLPSPDFARRAMRTDDALGKGIDAAMVVAAFVGIGFALDSWLGSTPWLTVGLFLLGTIGMFVTWKARYMAAMAALEAQRNDDAIGHRHAATAESTIEP